MSDSQVSAPAAFDWDEARARALIAPHRSEALALGAGVPGAPAQSALLPALRALQTQLGWVPPEAIEMLAAELNLTRADVFGVVSFYHDLRRAPPGHTIVTLCRAEACQVAGGHAVEAAVCQGLHVALGQTSASGVTLEGAYCLGLCAVAPAALVNGQPQGRLSPANALKRLVGP